MSIAILFPAFYLRDKRVSCSNFTIAAMNHLLNILVLLAFLTIPATLSAQDEELVGQLFEQSLREADNGNLEEAAVLMDSIIAIAPDVINAYWNLGIWYSQLGKHKLALDKWHQIHIMAPEDWKVHSKLIQTYEALGDTLARDYERKALIDLWESRTNSVLSETTEFCRDQFYVNEQHVMVFEEFSPSGEQMIFYRFFLIDSTGGASNFISLGSYETTTQISREMGEIGTDERLYHLDGYYGSSHINYGFYTPQPSYAVIKSRVIEILQKNHQNNE